jgi:hypothetical protein
MLSDYHKQALMAKVTLEDMNFLKQGLKKLDDNYPKTDGISASSSDLSNKELCNHLEFIRMYLSQYGFTFRLDDEEWERMKKQARETNETNTSYT